MISIRLDGPRSFEPGSEIEVTGRWDLAEQPESVELRLVWNTEGKGTTDIGVSVTEQIEFPLASDERTIALRLPRAPYSYSGRLVSIVWALELVALPGEEADRVEITIGPGGREVVPIEDLNDAST